MAGLIHPLEMTKASDDRAAIPESGTCPDCLSRELWVFRDRLGGLWASCARCHLIVRMAEE